MGAESDFGIAAVGSQATQQGTMVNQTMVNLTAEQLLGRIRKAFRSAFDVDPQTITIDTVPSDVSAWDSMGHVTLASSLEQEFGLTFDVDDLMAMENVKEICRIVQSKLGQVQSAQKQ